MNICPSFGWETRCEIYCTLFDFSIGDVLFTVCEHRKITSTIELLSWKCPAKCPASWRRGFKVLEDGRGRGDGVQSATHPGARPSSSAWAVGCSSPSERRGHSRSGPFGARDARLSNFHQNFKLFQLLLMVLLFFWIKIIKSQL